VLIDFGSARGQIASHSKTVSALVKPGYSPYEQYATDSRRQGPWTDIYALGATLYHAIAGKRPPDAPSRMVNDEYITARKAALGTYRSPFLAAIDKALELEVTERPQSIAEWRALLMAPEPKRDRGKLGLGRALGRSSTQRTSKTKAKVKPAERESPKAPVLTEPHSLVPTPPDAPQPKGQLLDFIEALRRRRPAAAAVKAAEAIAPAQKPAPRVAGEPEYKLGYGPPPADEVTPAPTDKKAKAKVPDPLGGGAPRPQRLRPWRFRVRPWQSLAFKLLIGLGVASLAVAYQDSLPRFEGHSEGLVSSQTPELVELGRLAGHKGAVTAVATADEGGLIVSAGIDGTLKVWSAGSGAPVRTIELGEGAARALAVDGQRLLSAHKSGAIVLWDLERAEKLATFSWGPAAVTSVAFVGDGSQFAAADEAGGIALFDLGAPSAPSLVLESAEGAAQTIAVARAAKLLVAGDRERGLRLWRTDTHKRTRTWRSEGLAPRAIDIAPDGRLVASGTLNGTVQVWSAGSSRPRRTLAAHTGRVTALAFAPGGRRLATAGEDGRVKLWDLSRGGRNPRVFRAHAGAVEAVAFSRDGQRVLSAGKDGIVRILGLASVLPGRL
jgi:WD40 repeat protein